MKFDEFTIGQVFTTSSIKVTKNEIIPVCHQGELFSIVNVIAKKE